METAALKKFAQAARRQLREQVSTRLEQVLRSDSVEIREKAKVVEDLKRRIQAATKDAIVDQVAYTWFNRFCALRYMDVNHYTRIGTVSPAEGFTQPEILQEAKQGVIDESIKVDHKEIFDLLNGRQPSRDPQGEAYRLLLAGACNAWHAQMPFLFPEIEDYTELLMPDDLLSENSVLQAAREVLTSETCQDVEVIGWLYQYYISERKDEVFAALKENQKIEAKDIPAATQLFTPHWIVRYLVENSLGRLWMLNHPDSKLVERMEYYIKPVQEETDFLKISSPEEIKVCDPACGSGHMLTYAFDLLFAIYEEQGYDAVQIPSLILQENLYGIEIDKRAGDLAAFALVMKAREKDKRFFIRGVEPNVCVLENVSFTDAELDQYMDAVGRDLFTEPLMETLRQFEQADNFGSLIRPRLTDAGYVRGLLESKNLGGDMFYSETHKKVLQVLKYAEFLTPRYHIVAANPPYMGGKGMTEEIKVFLEDLYTDVKTDLFAAFIIRNLELTYDNGRLGFMTPFVWMFISSYERLREILLGSTTVNTLVQLEYNSFEGSAIPVCAFCLIKRVNLEHKGAFVRLSDFRGSTIQAPKTLEAINNPNCGWFYLASTSDFLKIPGSPIAYWISDPIRNIFSEGQLLGDIVDVKKGADTGNNDYFLRFWHEVPKYLIGGRNSKWVLYNKGGTYRRWYGNYEYVIRWGGNGHELKNSSSNLRSPHLYFRPSLTWSALTIANFSVRYSDKETIFDSAGSSLFPNENIFFYLGYLNTPIAQKILDFLNPTMNYGAGTVANIPLILDVSVDEIVSQLIEISRADWNRFEISCDFRGNPLLLEESLKISLPDTYSTLRLKWSIEIKEMKKLEEANNLKFIEAYKLLNEVSPHISTENVTLLCNPDYRYRGNNTEEEQEQRLLADTMKEFISYAVGCMFGRYSLDKPGLILANAGDTVEDYLRQVPEPSFPPDEDNAIPVLEGEWFEDDIVARFKQFLKITFGEEHYDENLAFIEEAVGRDIRSYFVKDFYNEHVKMYKKRPIYWMFSSPKGSFNVLMYMHRYRPDTISVILNNYLRQYREKLNAHKAHQESISRNPGASQSEKTKALKEVEWVKKMLAELKEYEDEILYPLAMQKIAIDLDDGVKVNYAKFGKALREIKGL